MARGKTIRGIGGIAKISVLERKRDSLKKELKTVEKTLATLKKLFK